jgi:hypothetical protein
MGRLAWWIVIVLGPAAAVFIFLFIIGACVGGRAD